MRRPRRESTTPPPHDLDNLEFRCGAVSEVSVRCDFIAFFDCLHDIPDPIDALPTARSALAQDGAVMLVEPMSSDTVGEALNPLGRLLSGASIAELSAQRAVRAAGYRSGQPGRPGPYPRAPAAGRIGTARMATSTPFNLVYEPRP